LRIILILDNTSAHVLDYMSLFENIKVIFMPLTTAVMQLMDQGMITTLQLYYLCCTLKKLITETNVNNELTLHEFWQTSDIIGCVQIVGISWKELPTRLMNGCWKNSYPDAVNSSDGTEASLI
jgi:hypothetical protein